MTAKQQMLHGTKVPAMGTSTSKVSIKASNKRKTTHKDKKQRVKIRRQNNIDQIPSYTMAPPLKRKHDDNDKDRAPAKKTIVCSATGKGLKSLEWPSSNHTFLSTLVMKSTVPVDTNRSSIGTPSTQALMRLKEVERVQHSYCHHRGSSV